MEEPQWIPLESFPREGVHTFCVVRLRCFGGLRVDCFFYCFSSWFSASDSLSRPCPRGSPLLQIRLLGQSKKHHQISACSKNVRFLLSPLIQSLAKLTSPQYTTPLPAISCVYLTHDLTRLPRVHLRAVQDVASVRLWWAIVLLPRAGEAAAFCVTCFKSLAGTLFLSLPPARSKHV